MTEVKFQHYPSPPSFIGGWMMDTDICDELREVYDTVDSKYDKTRQYYRISSRKIPEELHKRYINQLHGCVDSYVKKFPWSKGQTSEWHITIPFNLQMYKADKGYVHPHIEDGGPKAGRLQRHLVFSTYLNDVKVRGETHFLLQKLKVKPVKGLTVIFPAGWMHPHCGVPAPNERKYIATGWCGFTVRGASA